MRVMNADKFYGFLFISVNYPTHMDSLIEN